MGGNAANGVPQQQRFFPVALAQIENGVEGERRGCEFQVTCSTFERGTGCLTVTGYAQGERIVASIRCALAWARLHCKAVVAQLFEQQQGQQQEDGNAVLLVDLGRADLDFHVDLSKGDLKKSGGSVGLAVACAMVRMMTGVGVEPCVAMTGEVTLSGAISGVSGLEGKLRYAHSSPRIKVVVLPRDNLAEATALVHKYGLNSVRLLPVSHMQQVIRLLFLGSVGGIGGGQGGHDGEAEAAMAMLEMASDLVGPSAALGARLRRVLCTEAHSWVLLEGGAVDFPTVECALLPGSGQRWFSGVTIAGDGDESGEGPPEVRDQAMLSLSCVRELLAGSGIMDHGVPRRLIMHDIFEPRWDIYLHVRAQAGKTRCIGLAAVCALLALALGRQIDEGIFLSGGVTLRGLVRRAGSVTQKDVMALVRRGCSRVLLSSAIAAKVCAIKAELLAQHVEGEGGDEEGRRRLEAMEVVAVENVLSMGQALCTTLWPVLRGLPTLASAVITQSGAGAEAGTAAAAAAAVGGGEEG